MVKNPLAISGDATDKVQSLGWDPAFKPLQGNPAFFESGHLGVHST